MKACDSPACRASSAWVSPRAWRAVASITGSATGTLTPPCPGCYHSYHRTIPPLHTSKYSRQPAYRVMMAMVTEPTVYKLAPRALARGRLETGKDGPAGIYPAGPTPDARSHTGSFLRRIRTG